MIHQARQNNAVQANVARRFFRGATQTAAPDMFPRVRVFNTPEYGVIVSSRARVRVASELFGKTEQLSHLARA